MNYHSQLRCDSQFLYPIHNNLSSHSTAATCWPCVEAEILRCLVLTLNNAQWSANNIVYLCQCSPPPPAITVRQLQVPAGYPVYF